MNKNKEQTGTATLYRNAYEVETIAVSGSSESELKAQARVKLTPRHVGLGRWNKSKKNARKKGVDAFWWKESEKNGHIYRLECEVKSP